MKRLAALLAVLALFGFGAWYIYRHTSWRVEKVHTGFQPEARRNPLLAAEFMLAKLGRHPVPRVGLPSTADGLKPADTILMLDRERGFTPQEAERLLAFAKQGGQLVVEVDATQGLHGDLKDPEMEVEHKAGTRTLALRDHLMERLGAEVVHVPWKSRQIDREPDAGDEKAEEERERRRKALWEPKLQLDEKEPFTLQVSPRWRLVDAGRSSARELGAHRGITGLEYPMDLGRIRIFVDLDCLRNAYLVKLDHAEFLAWLLKDRPREGRVWLVRGERTAHLLDWLKTNAWAAVWAIAVLTAIVMWRASRRLGPILPAPALARRSLLEHIDASGRLLWAEGQGSRMVRAARVALMRRLELAHPAWARLPLPVLSSRLADFGDIAEPEVRRALFDDHFMDAASFKDAIRTLESLRRKL